ncbi:MAG TPA: efflux RND transporter periplasmic adaptor subunit, partial [Gemmatimonadales bacterium]|nr:efflux RND transporter periplasmic adaptor subunit [Gemmatimonadales bacterium]
MVELTPAQVAAAKLTFAVAQARPTAGGLTATAQIEASPGRLARVGSRVAGRVTTVLVAEGDRVRAGAVLARIDAPELAEATAQYLAANAEAKVAREIADREKALFESRISSEREWRQAEADAVRAEAGKESAEGRLHSLGLSDADLDALQVVGHYNSAVAVRTPIGGIVASRKADVGQGVSPGEPLYEVVD